MLLLETLRGRTRTLQESISVEIRYAGGLQSQSSSRWVAKRKPLLTSRHKADRIQWARDHAHWTEDDWNSVLWTDESKFTIFGNGN